MQIAWTAPAVRDLEAARAFVGMDNPAAARKQMMRVIAAVETLRQFPQLGRAGRLPGTRELVVNRTPYIVPYRVRGEEIVVLRVLHTKRRWPDRI